MEGFLRAWSKGLHVSKVNPEAVAAMLKAGVPAEWEDETAGQKMLDASIGMNLSVTERLGDIEPDVWSTMQPRLLSSGATAEEVDVNSFLIDTHIAAANGFDRDQVEADAKAWMASNN